jgi:hypothetical protein
MLTEKIMFEPQFLTFIYDANRNIKLSLSLKIVHAM